MSRTVSSVRVAEPLGLHVDELVERRVDADGVREPLRPPEHHPRQVPRPDVRGDDPVAEHVRERPGVIGDRIDVLERLDERPELVDIDVERLGDVAPGGLHVVDVVDVELPREPRRTADQFGLLVGVLDPGVVLQKGDHLRVDRLVHRRRPL